MLASKKWTIALTALLAVMELVDSFFIETPEFAVGYAIVIALLAWWLSRTARVVPAVLIAILALLEFLSVLFVYPNADDPPALWDTVLFAVVTAATTVVAAGYAVTRRRAAPSS